jgi:PKD repeat protein
MKRTVKWAGLVVALGSLLVLTGCSLFNSPPVGNFSWSPFEPLARTQVRFSDMSTDAGGLFGGGGVVSWNWDFGDNDSSTTQNPNHEYEKSGSYTVRLTVTDGSGGATTIQKTIEISPSLDGRWRGFIVDPGRGTDQIEFDVNHSVSGGIQGTVYYLSFTFPMEGVSFDPGSKVVRFSITPMGIRLEGTLDAAERRIVGNWYVLAAPAQGFSWDVSL